MTRIIHVSDFHLEEPTPSDDKRKIVDALLKDLEKYVDDKTLFVFTGDLIDKGAYQFKEYKKVAFEIFESILIKPLVEKFPVLKNRIFIVPGNHDVFRDKIDPVTQAGLLEILTSTKNVTEFIKGNRNESKHLDRLTDYKNWEHSFYSEYPCSQISNFENSFIISIDGKKIGITCLNSSWLCKDDNDKEHLIIGKDQIENSLSFINKCDIKLALAHHPLEFLTPFDREDLKVELYKNYDAYFTGHVHELDSLYTQNLYGSIFISIANSTIADNPVQRRYVNGYQIVDIHPNEKIEVYYRKFLERHSSFVANTDVGTENASKEFQLLNNGLLREFNESAKLIENLENQYSDKLNDHLIMSSHNTNARCTIDNLFVEPTISNYPENINKGDEVKNYTIEHIITQKSNFLIYGLKESGKTILLDKLFLETLRKFNELKKVPVLVRFSELKSKRVDQIIREFLGVSSQDIKSFLEKNDTLLIIDDFSVSSQNEEQLLNLKLFLALYPRIQVIASATLILDNIIPTDYLIHNDIFRFELGFIQSLNSNQIKQFVSRWFAGKEIDLQESLEKLLKNFADFGLPRTPLSVTLFLWIFERQEKRPINNSVLVEMFIENLLEKTNIDNIYSETFDFKNKQRLLSFVAKYMHDKGNQDLNYSIDYVKLLGFVDDYLKTRFPGKPQKVLDDLIKRGILTFEQENLVKFKSAFFFHYFLALHFDYDPTFKQYVFAGENYLNYVEEIVYYSGLKRDDLQVLNFTQERLNEAFEDSNKNIVENYKRVDEVLEVKSSEHAISLSFDNDSFKRKPTEKEIEEVYDSQLSAIPVNKDIPKKENTNLETKARKDLVLKLASSVLKNSEDVDDFEAKKISYKNVLTSSIAFLMMYRDYLITYYEKHQEKPEMFPKNIDFHLFIRVLPLIHQVVIFNWIGSQKLRPVIVDKIEKDKLTLNISEFEKFMSVYIYADIKGSNYPELIQEFSKKTKYNYLKDLSFMKVLSYYHLRSKSPEHDRFYLKLLADLKEELGHLHKTKKSQFMREIEDQKKRDN